jgi:phosphatidylglycerol---prolipoprotein diacylglyceryl transferase
MPSVHGSEFSSSILKTLREICREPPASCGPAPVGANSIYWRKMIPFLRFGWLTIPTFGLMVACAMIGAYFVLRAEIARRGITSGSAAAEAEMFIAIPCVAGIVGAKFYHLLQSPRELFADPLGLIFSGYGFAWFGGLLAGFAAFVWLARHRKVRLVDILDAGSPAAALGYGIGRIGCLLSGDGDYGIPTSLPWGMSFPNGLVPTSERVHPTPVYELIVACMIAWFLWRLGTRQIAGRNLAQAGPTAPARKERAARGRPTRAGGLARGGVFAAYLVLTGVARFLVEFIRINPRSFLGMSNAQAASVVSVIAGALLWQRLKRTSGAQASPITRQ